ncbi:hypothetical protein ABIE61_001951 [Marinobacterium sp. MBR-111]|jgi:hypothetical protein|uniref:hypothetical protein n=1 Tax=Marinobacterium sp. MBR-111 TaxID=3156463 RepID=UPI0033962A24
MNNIDIFPKPDTRTRRFYDLKIDDLLEDETVLIAKIPTDNRGIIPLWDDLKKKKSQNIIEIEKLNQEKIAFHFNNNNSIEVLLTDTEKLLNILARNKILIDVSGLPHNVWAPILKCLLENNFSFRVLYTEAESYRLHPSPASETLFDLSIEYGGLAPLPGFAKLSGPEDDSKCLYVALLGFEGNRPERLVLQLDPEPKVVPIIGVPGFKIEFPAFTVSCNRNLLEEYRAFSELRFARASCPYEAFEALQSIHKDFPDYYMYIAPVGTKPHAIGAIWYSILNPDTTEIMYDFPIHKKERSDGIGLIHIYNFS